jgi:hypothetical protein
MPADDAVIRAASNPKRLSIDSGNGGWFGISIDSIRTSLDSQKRLDAMQAGHDSQRRPPGHAAKMNAGRQQIPREHNKARHPHRRQA